MGSKLPASAPAQACPAFPIADTKKFVATCQAAPNLTLHKTSAPTSVCSAGRAVLL